MNPFQYEQLFKAERPPSIQWQEYSGDKPLPLNGNLTWMYKIKLTDESI